MTGGKTKSKEGRMSYKDRKRYIDAVASGRVTPKVEDKDAKKKRRKV